MNHADFINPYLSGVGTEIGAFDSPIPGIAPIYVDKFNEFAGKQCLADYPGAATALPFFDCSLDYVANSHVFEHLANPVSALVEWQRVLKPGGHAYVVVPDRRYTFDRERELTLAQHMVEDYFADTGDTDETHIDDFVFGIDWDEISPGLSEEEKLAQRTANAEYHRSECREGREINIHFHVFEPSNFRELLTLCNQSDNVPLSMEIIEIVEKFPIPVQNGFLAILQKPVKPRLLATRAANHIRERSRLAPAYPVNPLVLGEFH